MQEVGTMRCELNRIQRTNFDPEVNNAYDADKNFITSYVDAHIIEMVLEFFDMETVDSPPRRHIPPDFQTEEEKKCWVYLTLG